MSFGARVYFDFTNPGVWHLYRFFTAAGVAGADLSLEWRPFAPDPEPGGRRALESFEGVRLATPGRHGAYLQALLSLRHLEAASLDADETYRVAAAAAGVPLDFDREQSAESMRRSTSTGASLGITGVPTLYRHGPVMRVTLTPASLGGDALARLRLLDGILDDDGIWELVKP